LGRAWQPATFRRQFFRDIDTFAELPENLSELESALNMNRDYNGCGIAPPTDFLRQSLIRKKDHLTGVPLRTQSMLCYGVVGAAADSGI